MLSQSLYSFFFFSIVNLIYLFMAALDLFLLHGLHELFSSCSEQVLLSSCNAH